MDTLLVFISLITVVFVIITEDPRWLILILLYFAYKTFETKENIEFTPKPLEPTLNDPFMNNIDSDVLKILPKDTKELSEKQANYLHWNNFKNASDIFDRSEDRTFYTTPVEDQEAFISFLNYDLKVPLDINHNDLKKDHYLFPNQNLI